LDLTLVDSKAAKGMRSLAIDFGLYAQVVFFCFKSNDCVTDDERRRLTVNQAAMKSIASETHRSHY